MVPSGQLQNSLEVRLWYQAPLIVWNTRLRQSWQMVTKSVAGDAAIGVLL